MLQEKLKRIQETMNSSSKSIYIDNETRWNSLYDCINRFIELRDILILLLPPEDFEDFDWRRLIRIQKVLSPLKV